MIYQVSEGDCGYAAAWRLDDPYTVGLYLASYGSDRSEPDDRLQTMAAAALYHEFQELFYPEDVSLLPNDWKLELARNPCWQTASVYVATDVLFHAAAMQVPRYCSVSVEGDAVVGLKRFHSSLLGTFDHVHSASLRRYDYGNLYVTLLVTCGVAGGPLRTSTPSIHTVEFLLMPDLVQDIRSAVEALVLTWR